LPAGFSENAVHSEEEGLSSLVSMAEAVPIPTRVAVAAATGLFFCEFANQPANRL